MDKPQSRTFVAYEWGKVRDYIEAKYQTSLDGHYVDGEWRSFWRWVVRMCEPTRGAFFMLPENWEDYAVQWQADIMRLILTEFPELATVQLYADW